jgi:hypothetical protein
VFPARNRARSAKDIGTAFAGIFTAEIHESLRFRHKSASFLLDFFCVFGGFFDRHIVKFFGIEDIAAFQAFNIFGVFVSGDNSYPWVFAGGNHCVWQVWIWKLLPQIVASFSTNSNAILVNLSKRSDLRAGKGAMTSFSNRGWRRG